MVTSLVNNAPKLARVEGCHHPTKGNENQEGIRHDRSCKYFKTFK